MMFFARFPLPVLERLGRAGGLVAALLTGLAALAAEWLGAAVGPWNGTQVWSPVGTGVAIALGAVTPLLALQAIALLVRGRAPRAALSDAELVKRLASRERPLTVCLDCRSLGLVPPCDHCGKSSSCVELRTRADVRQALQLLNLEAPPVIEAPPSISAGLATAVRKAIAEATRRRHEFVGLEHLLLGLSAEATARASLEAGGARVAELEQRLGAVLEGKVVLPEGVSAEPRPTPEIEQAISRASLRVLTLGRDEIDSADAVVAVVADPSVRELLVGVGWRAAGG